MIRYGKQAGGVQKVILSPSLGLETVCKPAPTWIVYDGNAMSRCIISLFKVRR